MEYAIFVILGLLIGNFLPSYFSKKGENLATKEDIGKITGEIESIRRSVEIGRDAHIDFVKNKKEALINFYDELTSFTYEYLIINFGDFPMDEGQSLFRYQTGFAKSVAEIVKTHQRLYLYLPNESELLKAATAVSNCAVDARRAFSTKFGAVKFSAIDEAYTYGKYQKGDQSREQYKSVVDAANAANDEYWELMTPLVQEFKKLSAHYMSELNNHLQLDEISPKETN